MGGVAVFVCKRLFWSLPVLFAVLTVTFFVLRVVPGGPYDREKELPEAVRQNLLAQADLDKPVGTQFANYLGRVVTGDLDWSMKFSDRSVNQILGRSFPVSLQLGALAIGIALIGGLLMGAISAVRKGGVLDHTATVIASVGFAIPSFVLGTVFILLFALTLQMFPPALWEGPSHVLLPALTLAAAPGAYIARLARSGLLEVLSSDFIRTARAKGCTERAVVFRHALRNASGPILTVLGPIFAWLITGSFIVEYIFAIPGMGRTFVTAVVDRDYTLVMGATLLYSLVVVLANLAVDILYGVVDPRLRSERA